MATQAPPSVVGITNNSWSDLRQDVHISPVRGKMIPEKWSPGKMVHGKMIPGKNGPRKIDPRKIGPRLNARPTIFCLRVLGLFASFGFVSNIPRSHHDAQRPLHDFLLPSFGFVCEFWVCFEHSTHTPRCSTPAPRFFVSKFWVCLSHFFGNHSSGDQFSGDQFSGDHFSRGSFFQGSFFLGIIFPGDHFSGIIFPGAIFPGIIFPGFYLPVQKDAWIADCQTVTFCWHYSRTSTIRTRQEWTGSDYRKFGYWKRAIMTFNVAYWGKRNLTFIKETVKLEKICYLECASCRTRKECTFGWISASRATTWQLIRARSRSGSRNFLQANIYKR